jgi:hypothetical protein
MRRLVLPLALAATLGLSSPARAGEPADDSGTRAVAAALEAANVRAKAKIEAARLLEALGRREEALEALREVEPIEREGRTLVERLLGISSAPRSLPTRRASPEPAGPPPARFAIDSVPSTTVPRAVDWLLAAQGADGWFSRDAEAAPGREASPRERDVATTALAVVALYDVADDPDDRAGAAARLGVDALLSVEDRLTGVVGRDLEEQALATWALATGYSRTARSTWREPLAAALGRCLAAQQPDGLWQAESKDDDDSAVLTAWMVVALHEAYAMPKLSAELGIGEAIGRAVDRAAPSAWKPSSPLGRIAQSLVASGGRERSTLPESLEVTPEGRVYATALLLGAAAARVAPAGDEWFEATLAPAMRRQAGTGPLAGAFLGADRRSTTRGRAWSTAAMVLAWRTRTTTFRPPRGD